jgi:serine protease Do
MIMTKGRSALAATLLAGAVLGVAITASINRQSCAPAQEGEGVATPAVLPVASVAPGGAIPLPDFTELVNRLSPSIVNISTVSEEEEEQEDQLQRRRERDPFDFFHHFGPRRSLGSGFVLDASGYIITNHHVVDEATEIVVRLNDEKEYKAEIVGGDAKTDIAVIKISDASGLVPVPLGDSDDLQVGEWVVAVGSPFGLDHTVTAGIVSAKGRKINRPDQSPYDDFIQTDAAINPGNSGGPLVNLKGQVVGINTAIYSRSGGNIGIGFAIPINLARQIVPQLKEAGYVTRGWLGVLIQPVDEDIAKSLDLPEAQGALVAKVFADSPAAKAGVEVGDVIVEFDGQRIRKSNDLPLIVAATPVGKAVGLTLVRAGSQKTVDVTIAKLEEEAVEAKPVKADELGLSVQDMSPEIANDLGLPRDSKGVVVSGVRRGSPADEAGLRAGDVIESIGNQPVDDVKGFRKFLSARDPADSVLVLVRRGDQTLFRVIKPAPPKKRE